MNKTSDSSFKPGAGEVPPVLAGRKKEKEVIKLGLERLKDGLSPGQNIALIGPRGNGKTALLKWAKEQVGLYNGEVECVELNPNRFRAHEELVRSFENRGVLSNVAGVGIKTPVVEFEVSRQGHEKKELRHVLEQRCAGNGLAVLVDEAHTLYKHPDAVREFLVDMQTLAGDRRPLLLILAGTPEISMRFAEIEASFWNRMKKLGIGLLDSADAQEALRIPLKDMGYGIEEKTLDRAAGEAQCYPYFLQIVGAELHRAAKTDPGKLGSGREIGDAILEQALKEFGAERDNYYSDRYRELRQAGILPAAEAVARRFVLHKERSISGAAFELAVEQSIDTGMEELAKSGGIKPAAWFEAKLRDVGFVWSPIGNERSCEPGIPSLMNYILEWSGDRQRELERIRQSSPSDSAPG